MAQTNISFTQFIGRAKAQLLAAFNTTSGHTHDGVNSAPIFPNPYGAQDYFVDLNASSANTAGAMATYDATVDGKSWATAFQLLSSAIAASNTSIGLTANRWWARRNRIFVCGDGITESLTVLPEKCDIIGVGTDLYAYPRIIGVHSSAADKPGCRFINIGFQGSGAGDLFKTTVAGHHGLSFIGCHFVPTNSGMTKCLELLDASGVRIEDCTFKVGAGNMTHIFGTAISIEGTTSIHDLLIKNCDITATIGVAVANGTLMGSVIKDCVIRATGLTINDGSSDVQIVNNRLISDATDDGTGTGGGALAIKCSTALAVGNLLTCGDHLNAPFPIQGTLA